MAKQPGFMIYADDWTSYTEEYTAEEVGQIVKALLSYFLNGEHTEFTDRGMRQFYRQAVKGIDLDKIRYEDKCLKNAHNRYKQESKKREEKPLDFDDWYTAIYLRNKDLQSTTVNDGQRPSTNVTNTNNQQPTTNTNNQKPTVNYQSSILKEQFERESRGETCNEGLSPEEFDRRRAEWISVLGGYGQ